MVCQLLVAGDVNGDGYQDLLIGAPSESVGLTGKAYVVFGWAGIGESNGGLFQLSSLNGANGFKLIGY